MRKEDFVKELTALINRFSLEKEFNDTPDHVLATVALESMATFARNSAVRDEFHEFKTADSPVKQSNRNKVGRYPGEECDCPGCRLRRWIERGEESVSSGSKVHEMLDKLLDTEREEAQRIKLEKAPKEVQAIAKMFGGLFPGSSVEILQVKPKDQGPRDKRRKRNKRRNGNDQK